MPVDSDSRKRLLLGQHAIDRAGDLRQLRRIEAVSRQAGAKPAASSNALCCRNGMSSASASRSAI